MTALRYADGVHALTLRQPQQEVHAWRHRSFAYAANLQSASVRCAASKTRNSSSDGLLAGACQRK